VGLQDQSAINHVGLCVTDISRSRRFYEELLGFEYLYEGQPPDAATTHLLQVPEPVGLTAIYLRLDGLVLELLHFERPDNPVLSTRRVMNEPGLTHLSVSVADIPAVVARLCDFGAAVVEGTDLGAAVMVRDPDGQLIELLTMDYRRAKAAEGR
jgi:lactoylglutathione lyase